MHAVQFVHQHMRFAIFKVRLFAPFDFLAYAGIRLVEINLLLRLIFLDEARFEALGFERSDDMPGFLFRWNQKMREFVSLRRGQTETPDGAF